jgi:arylformamidase
MPYASDLKEFYDISARLEISPIYPGDRPFTQEWVARMDEGDGYNLSALILGSHAGTHLDFPSHLLKSGKSQEEYFLERFIIPAEVVCASGEGPVQPRRLKGRKIDKGQALLFKTDNSARRLMHQAAFSEDFISLSLGLAQLCVVTGVSLVGIDYLSVDKYADDSLPVHHTLLENDVFILEGIDLADVPCGRYSLICLPLRIKGAEASPVRAVLVR